MIDQVRASFEQLQPFGDALWQSSLWLAGGVLAARFATRRPARAHAVLAACLLGAVLTPLFAALVRAGGWGLLPAGAPAEPHDAALPHGPALAALRGFAPRIELVVAGAWTLASSLALLRLVAGWRASRRLLRDARPVADAEIRAAARAAAARLGVPLPRVLRSSEVDSPVVWCWGRRPVVVLPHRAVGDLLGVFGHELAHWRRRDHLSTGLADLVVALLPWQPLAWLARRRLADLGERTCDAWAVEAGAEPVDYAEALVRLVPQRRRGLVLGARLERSALAQRVGDLLDDGARRAPRIGRRFGLAAGGVTLVATSALSLAQNAPPPAPSAPFAASDAQLAALAEALCTDVCAMPAELDLGEVVAGTTAAGSIWLTNGGERPWMVLSADPTCGCTTVTDVAGTLLIPGAAVEVPLVMEAPKIPGTERVKYVDVQVEGHAPMRVPVRIRAQPG